MQRKEMEWEQLIGYGYSNLMRVLVDKACAKSNGSLGEFGWDGWPGTYMAIDPEEQLIILYFIQRVDYAYTLRREIRNIIYGSLK
jgi:CubicO group peptidase (beta-lactamase class C family)